MKRCVKTTVVLVMVFGLGMVLASRVTAQVFTTLYRFSSGMHGWPAYKPYSNLILSSNALYGTAYYGGSGSNGIVFAVGTDGTGFRTVHNFVGSDGAQPYDGLLLIGDTLYGTTYAGGSTGNGTVFASRTDGTGFRILHHFGGNDGAQPFDGLLRIGDTLYGTTFTGGSSGSGTVFAVNANGSGFVTLYNFSARSIRMPYANADGANPAGGLVLSGSTLYGTAYQGGASGSGTVFALGTDGTNFTVLHAFTDGGAPEAGLTLSGNILYGTTDFGGPSGKGTVFAIGTDGTGFTNLHYFAGFPSEGTSPRVGLTLSGNSLYGTTWQGGHWNGGTVFRLNTDGSGFTTLYSFTAGSDGLYPNGLIAADNTLYGTTCGNDGTVFSLSLPVSAPQLAITCSGPDIVLTWPTNDTSSTLQSCTDLGSPVWSTNSQAPVVLNGQNTVTNPISGTPHFFRLSK